MPKKSDTKLQEQIEKLTKQLEEQELITKRAQSDYLRVKMDMDALVTRTDEQQKRASLDALVQTSQKILPFVTQLSQSLAAADEKTMETPWAQGIQLIYQKMMASLEQLHISPINTQPGDDPDLQAHIPVSTQPVEDTALSGKIVSQIEQGYQYNNNGVEVVIVPAKVVVGQ